MSDRQRFSSQQKLPTLDFSQNIRSTTDILKANITVQSGDAQFVSFRSLNELNPKFPIPNHSVDSSYQLNSSVWNDLSQNRKMVQILGKTLYQQNSEYKEAQETLMRKMRSATRMQRQIKKVPHRIEPFVDNPATTSVVTQAIKKKVSFPMYFNGAFFQKLTHSWIPTVRESTMAADYQKKIYIFGGIGSEVMGDLIEYEIPSCRFREIKQNGDIPLNRYGHCLHSLGYPMQLSTQFSYDNQQQTTINGKQLILFGGEMQYNSALRLRENLSDTRILDLDTQTWQLLKPNIENIPESRRSFGSCIVGKGLIIMGGIRSRFSVFNDMHYMNLSSLYQNIGLCKWTPLETQKNPFSKGLAFQQLICTYSRPQYIFEKREFRAKPYKGSDYEGIYCFGGCYIDEQKNTQHYDNFMAMLKLDLPNNPWIIPETTGKAPQSRIQHSASYLSDMNIVVIFGGRDDSKQNPYFNDLYVYKLFEREWVQIDIYGGIPRTRAAHSAIAYKTQLLLLGGVNLNGYLEFSVQSAEFNQNQIRQLQAEYKPDPNEIKLEEIQQKETPQQQLPNSNNKYFSLHQLQQPIKQKTKTEIMAEQIKQLSFQNFSQKHFQ